MPMFTDYSPNLSIGLTRLLNQNPLSFLYFAS